MKTKFPPWLALLFLSPVVGELLSGSAPPSEFFSPFGFTILLGLYGCGAIVIRELKIRWRKGIGTLLLLGAAYGILEEGLMVSSFFNPNWQDLGILGEFGRWLGVNWVWTVELTIYHAIVSITIPIILVELVYPNYKGEPWISNRSLKIVLLFLVFDVVFGFFLFALTLNFWPPLSQYFLFMFIMCLFVYFAYKLPKDWARNGEIPIKRPSFFGVISLLSAFTCALIYGVLPHLSGNPFFPIFIIVLGISFLVWVIKHLKQYKWKDANDYHIFSLVSGALTLFIFLAPIQELDASRLDNTTGMSLVGLSFLVGLTFLGWKVRNRTIGYKNEHKSEMNANILQ